MELADLVNAMRVVEVSAKTRKTAMRTLVEAADLQQDGVSPETVLEAIEQREATAPTIVDERFAMPHAVIPWNGDYRVVLGRSRLGVDFGIPDHSPVQLMALIVVSQSQEELHLEILAALASLFESAEFRKQLIDSPNVRSLEEQLSMRVGLTHQRRSRRAPEPGPGRSGPLGRTPRGPRPRWR